LTGRTDRKIRAAFAFHGHENDKKGRMIVSPGLMPGVNPAKICLAYLQRADRLRMKFRSMPLRRFLAVFGPGTSLFHAI